MDSGVARNDPLTDERVTDDRCSSSLADPTRPLDPGRPPNTQYSGPDRRSVLRAVGHPAVRERVGRMSRSSLNLGGWPPGVVAS
jgi:hypothetical protein